MLKKLLFAIALTTYGVISAQTVLIDPNGDGGFETGATFAANGWTPSIVFGPNFNQWTTNTAATGYTGARAAYITNDTDGSPPTPPYAYSGAQDFLAPNFYKDVYFDASESNISLSFDWKEEGGTLLKVWLISSSTPFSPTPLAPTTISADPDHVLLGTYTGATSWTSETITIPSSYADNGTYRLLFQWTNDGSAPTAPPAAIDNISLVTNCVPSGSSTSSWIQNFTTAVPGSPFNITDTNPAWVAPGYENNSATDFVEQFPGGEVDFTVIFGGGGTNGFNIWVDWDGDGDFLSAPNEKVFATGILTPSFVSGFQIPSTIPPGTYTMRIRSDFNNADPAPCGYIAYGESKDYSLIVSDINCLDNPSNIAISAIDYTTATVTWDPASQAPANGYEYFITQNPNPIIYNQTPTGTSATTSVNLTGLSADTTYYVWVRSVCGTGWGQQGEWQGSATFNTLVYPPTTTNVSICPGDPSDVLTADAACVTGATLSNTVVGSITSSSTYANILDWFTVSSDPCDFTNSYSQQRYETFDFQVDTAGTYFFSIDGIVTTFDSMGYIVYGGFTPGDCTAGGTYVAGADDGFSSSLDAQIEANLVPGITYTLVTTSSGFGSPGIGPFQWDITGAGNLIDPYSPPSGIEWYASASGGTPIFTGTDFDPVAEGVITGSTPGVYSYWAACSSSPDVRARADFNVGKAWIGAVDSNWNTPGNWSPSGAPTDSDCVIITTAGFSPIIDGITEGEGYRLIIENGATLTQQPNSILTITDAINVEAGGTYTMLDSASLFQDTDVANTVNGTFTMQRTATIKEDDYVYWSSPVNSFNIEDISINTPNGYKFIWEPTATRPVGPPPDSDPRDFGEWQSADTGAMDVGKGYIVKGPTGHGSTDAPFTATFSGTPNNGTIIQPITRGTYQGVGYTYNPYSNDILNITSDDDNWNLIGNPYPSALSIEDFLTDNSTIDGNVYLWTHGTDIGAGNVDSFYDDFTYNYNTADYIAINSVGVSTPVGIDHKFIGAGQGFFVLMNDAGTTNESVTFENYMRHTASYRNDQFYRSADTDTDTAEEDLATKHRIWLDYISPSGSTNTTLIGYANGATNDKDRMYDAKTTRGEGLNFYSMIEEDAYLIQGRQTPFVDTDTVPLGLNITEAGIQTIAINTVDGLFLDTDQDIYIEDLLTGITHNISNAPYTFTSEAGIINDRLVLTYRANNLSVDTYDHANAVKVYKENNSIVVNAIHETIQAIEVYDMLGRTLFTNTALHQTQFTINALQPTNSTLFLKVKLTNGEQSIAKIIF